MAAGIEALVTTYAQAKSCQDVEAALAVCHDDFLLHTAAFRSTARGRTEASRQLTYFFQAFPDYSVELDGAITNAFGHVCSGQLSMTLRGKFAGFGPTGETAKLPFFCLFTVRDGLLASEHFHFSDLDLCAQLGLPLAAFRRATRIAAHVPSALLSLA